MDRFPVTILERFVRSKLTFYFCDYQDFTRRYPHSMFKEVRTDLQKLYADLENRTIELIIQELENDPLVIRPCNTKINGRDRTTLIVTHFPVDLLNSGSFAKLDLLESHTGIIKRPAQWSSKLKGKKDQLARIPFNQMTVQLFGDSGGMLGPYPMKIREELIKVAETYRWNSLTTKSRILLTVEQHRNFTLEKTVKQLFK